MSTDQPERLDLNSMNVAEERLAKLREDFPEVFRDGKVDFDALRRSLGDWVEPGRERFGLNWPGKAECMKVIQAPSVGTLLPMREESVEFDTTQNMIIEGDNLEVLKLLQKSYYGKVKMIYIDPPYNTGGEFIYPDRFQEGLQDYLKFSGQVDDEGFKVSTNTESGGRYHTNWLNMMYPRLFLARNLLDDLGAIFVSIDEHEYPRLRSLMDEIFGEENFVADFVWAAGRKNDSRLVSVSHEYIVCYARSQSQLLSSGVEWRQRKKGLDQIYSQFRTIQSRHPRDYQQQTIELKEWYKGLPDGHPAKAHRHYCNVDQRGIYFAADISWPGGGGPKYDVLHPLTGKPVKVPNRGWITPDSQKMASWIEADRVHFGSDESSVPCLKTYLSDQEYQAPYSVFYQDGRAATKRLRELLGEGMFDFPKDEIVIQEIVALLTRNNDIVLDFFAGSGTSAHSVMLQNLSDGQQRRFVLVQLPETVKDRKLTIAAVCRERVRRSAEYLRHQAATDGLFDAPTESDLGFRAYKLTTSNFKPWQGEAESIASIDAQLEAFADHLMDERTAEDILTEILLKAGFELTTPTKRLSLAGKEVYSVAEGALLVCLDRELTLEVIEAMIDQKPSQIICLDAGFQNNDQLKVNAVQAIKSRARSEESTIVFKVV